MPTHQHTRDSEPVPPDAYINETDLALYAAITGR